MSDSEDLVVIEPHRTTQPEDEWWREPKPRSEPIVENVQSPKSSEQAHIQKGFPSSLPPSPLPTADNNQCPSPQAQSLKYSSLKMPVIIKREESQNDCSCHSPKKGPMSPSRQFVAPPAPEQVCAGPPPPPPPPPPPMPVFPKIQHPPNCCCQQGLAAPPPPPPPPPPP
ncbi:hypothetical protein K432DRAFT_223397, partial [Lepidopterella palustris CBS 459.81]